MKKLLFTALIAVAIGTSAFADGTKLTYKVLNHFKTEFSGAENVTWKLDNNFAKASFVYDGEKMEAFYNTEGDLIGTSRVFAFDKLPKSALATITKKYPYPPYKLNECIEFTNAEGEKNYFVGFETSSESLVLQVGTTGDVSVFKKTIK